MKRFLLCCCLWIPGVAVAQLSVSLPMCREMALQASKELQIAGREREKAASERQAYRAGYFPKFSVVGYGFYHQKRYHYKLKGGYLPVYKPDAQGSLQPDLVIDPETHQPVVGADGQPVFREYAFLPDIRLRLDLRGVYTAGVQLEQPVYLGGKVRAALRLAETGEDLAADNIRFNRSEVLLETDKAYWQLLRLEEQQVAAMKYREVVSELLKNLQDAQAVGMATLNDVLKARVRYNEAELMLQKVQNGKMLARMNLCRLIGLDLQTDLSLQDSLTAEPEPGIWKLDSSILRRPDYQMLEKEIILREKQVDLIRADFLPQIGVTAGYGYGGGLKLNGDDEAGATFSALAAVKIPVFNWGEGRNKIRASRLEEEISRLNLEKSADLMRLEVTSARLNIEDAVSRVNMAAGALRQAKENLKISDDQYQVGMEDLTSLLEAQAQWQEAWSQWIDAKTVLHLSESVYLKAIGKLE